ncbi:MAG: undecaprenyl-diphosphate phosphatase [Cyclobacteriaceae bacterium]|nr:undecaprenyl-diphosphate phosphatase [Cyclobacteriaceae bacterium]
MSYFQALLLAIVEGITEFLPVSSTGHLIVASSLMGIASDPFTKLFTVAIQFGTILSVLIIYWRKFLQSIDFYVKLLIAFLPAVVFGLLLGDWIDLMLERVDVVGFALLLGGVVLLFVDRWFSASGQSTPTNRSALMIGLFQCLAILLPGLSRSAATIIGGLTQKLDRKAAAEFSFFLAVPTMAAATAYKLLKFFLDGGAPTQQQWILLLVGNVAGLIVAWIAIRSFIQFLSNHGFRIFGVYRIIVGTVILLLYYGGYHLAVI